MSVKEKSALARERKRARGVFPIQVFVPYATITAIDKLKTKIGTDSRAVVVEQAISLFLEQQTRDGI